jgi:AraC-like DNA-binding protein
MLCDNIKPRVELEEFIKLFRIVDFCFKDFENIPFKAYPPRPQECLQFYPRDSENVVYPNSRQIQSQNYAAITGQHTVVTNRHIGKNFITFQVVFQPGALCRLTGIPAVELMNGYWNAEDILGSDIKSINDQLGNTSSYNSMVDIVENFLLMLVRKQKKKIHSVDLIANFIINHCEINSIDWLAKEACLSHRQFDRKFKERIGINPKMYSRVVRFDRAFRIKNQFPNLDWLSIALRCGYQDYQHLAKEYKLFTGCTPVEFYSIETQAPERFFGDVEI